MYIDKNTQTNNKQIIKIGKFQKYSSFLKNFKNTQVFEIYFKYTQVFDNISNILKFLTIISNILKFLTIISKNRLLVLSYDAKWNENCH